MATTTFIDQSTVIRAAWLNDVNDFTYEMVFPTVWQPGATDRVLLSNSSTTATWVNKSSVGITDHGGLTGLSDDDHTQYHNDARALTWLGTRSTTDLPEGLNLYWTAARFDTAFAAKNAYTVGGTPVALADGGTGSSLIDPNADNILFWDDSAGQVTWLTLGASLNISGTTLRRAALTGDVTAAVNSNTTTLATVNSNVGTFGSTTKNVSVTVNGKGLVTAISEADTTNTTVQKVEITKNSGAVVSTRKQLNFIEGTNVTLTIADDSINDQTDITINSSIAGGTVSDADYGDITVSSSGTVWTVDNSAITYAKIQNVSATDKILGRSTAGAGVVEEIACTAAGRALIDDADNTAQRTTLGLGSIATQNSNNVSITGGSITGITDLAVADGGTGLSSATAYAVLCGGTTSTSAFQSIASVGTAGQVLVSNGAGSLPSFQGSSRVVNRVNTAYTLKTTGTTAIPNDDTIPQNTEGDEYFTCSITPANSANILVIDVKVHLTSSAVAPQYMCAALFQDTTASALACGVNVVDSSNRTLLTTFTHVMTAGTTSSTTFKVRCGGQTGSTTTVNGSAAARIYGGVLTSSITITEYSA